MKWISLFSLILFLWACQPQSAETKEGATQDSSSEALSTAPVSEVAPVSDIDTSLDGEAPLSPIPAGNFVQQEPDPEHVKGYQKITWLTLKDVEFENKYYENEDQYFLQPTYGEKLQALADKKVYISGYVIPIDPDEGIFVLSANTFSSCFFCGNAGPESIVELVINDNQTVYKTDQWASFKGVLKLNSDDLDHLYYILEEAIEVPQKK